MIGEIFHDLRYLNGKKKARARHPVSTKCVSGNVQYEENIGAEANSTIAQVCESIFRESAKAKIYPRTAVCMRGTRYMYLVPGVDADGQTLGQLQEGDVELLRLPSPVPEVAVAVVPRHAHLPSLV